MKIKPTDDFINITNDKFSLYFPVQSFKYVALFADPKNNAVGDLCIQLNYPNNSPQFSYLKESYDYLLNIYQVIINKFDNKYSFIDLNCGGTRFFMRREEIVGASYVIDKVDGYTTEYINLYVSSDSVDPQFQMRIGELLKPFYDNLLAQLAYCPAKKETIASTSFFNNKENNPRQLCNSN